MTAGLRERAVFPFLAPLPSRLSLSFSRSGSGFPWKTHCDFCGGSCFCPYSFLRPWKRPHSVVLSRFWRPHVSRHGHDLQRDAVALL